MFNLRQKAETESGELKLLYDNNVFRAYVNSVTHRTPEGEPAEAWQVVLKSGSDDKFCYYLDIMYDRKNSEMLFNTKDTGYGFIIEGDTWEEYAVGTWPYPWKKIGYKKLYIFDNNPCVVGDFTETTSASDPFYFYREFSPPILIDECPSFEFCTYNGVELSCEPLKDGKTALGPDMGFTLITSSDEGLSFGLQTPEPYYPMQVYFSKISDFEDPYHKYAGYIMEYHWLEVPLIEPEHRIYRYWLAPSSTVETIKDCYNRAPPEQPVTNHKILKCLFPRLYTGELIPRITNKELMPRISCINEII